VKQNRCRDGGENGDDGEVDGINDRLSRKMMMTTQRMTTTTHATTHDNVFCNTTHHRHAMLGMISNILFGVMAKLQT
jgi:hypothetical protein